MDVYCHPFTSGGQEIPIQEAKLTELITLVTDYSCGSDSCCPSSGGIPLDWSEYREPGTQFIKASTSAGSIANNLKKVYKMKAQKRRALERKSRQYVLDNYDISVIGSQLEDIIDKMPEVSFDFDLSFKPKNSLYSPPNIKNNDEWIIDLYKNILHRDVDKSDQGFRHWMQRLSSDMTREQVLEYFQSVAAKENNENQKIKLDDLFEKNGKKKALMVCSGDLTSLFTATSLLDSFHENYPDTDLYFACHPQFQNIFNGNPNIKKVIPYHQAMEDEFQMIGRSNHEGYVDYYINLNNSILKNVSSKNCYELC